ncbi:DUF2712 domain-containing protein [Bacillus tuaregi]|uniref:DUF2712 domain-containing protein n=1 Tax=Bacillus tuaregi TaxID=1816695 RepID=UPI0008F91807|nr:DUF2712 domain-containing protein [Bacillus tuaregi]
MKKIKSLKMKLAVAGLTCLMASSIGMSSASAAGNYKDTPFKFYYNGDGSDRFTDMREKRDYTSSYVHNYGSNYGYSVIVYGSKNYSSSGIGTYATAGPIPHVGVGEAKYLPNYVKERGYNYAQLGLMSDSHSASVMAGEWSPDSI